MGIDWEEILDVEGADMAEVYNENIPEEDSKYYGLVVENHYSESGDTVGAYIYSIMWHFNQAVASWCYRGLTHVLEGNPDDPYHELEDKTCDELIEECIKLSQDAKHAKSALRDAEQNLDTLLDYLDQFVVYSCNANRSDRSELESQLEYEEESMRYDEMHEKYEAMTHEELMKKHIEISWIADAAKFFSQLIEWYYIKGLVVDLKHYFRDAQNLKDLIEKYKKPEPETLEMIKPRSKKIGRKSRSDWEAERKAQEAKREEERKFFQEFGEEDELPL